MATSRQPPTSRGPINRHNRYITLVLPHKEEITNGYILLAVPNTQRWDKTKDAFLKPTISGRAHRQNRYITLAISVTQPIRVQIKS